MRLPGLKPKIARNVMLECSSLPERCHPSSVKIGVIMAVGRGATAEKAKILCCRDLVPASGWNENRITRDYFPDFTIEVHETLPFEEEIELFAYPVIMPLRGLSSRNRSLGEALLLDRSIGPVQDTSDRGSIPRCKRLLFSKLA